MEAVSLVSASCVAGSDTELPVFQGAVGYGRTATGWRGGDILKVDNPDPAGGAAALDSDQNGMSDDWERRHSGVDPDLFDAWYDRDGDGWSNLEEYLSELAGDHVAGEPASDQAGQPL